MVKFCTNCGASIPDDKNFCTECGSSVAAGYNGTAAPQTPPPVYEYQNTAPAGETVPAKGSKYDPITTGGYIGIGLLMCIPVVGLILMIIWAFGGCKKVNKRNLARASLIMMAIGLVFSLIFSFVLKSVFHKVVETAGLDTNAIASLIGGEEEVTNSDIEELQALGNVLESLEALSGESGENSEDEGEGGSLNDLVDEVTEINQAAEAANDGWPASLREYPGGTATATASYRTEIKDTTLEEMLAWIEDLKSDGFEYQDFYDFGMTEEQMLEWNGWWATDGEIYLSVSYSEGVVIVDHTKELPDLSGLF